MLFVGPVLQSGIFIALAYVPVCKRRLQHTVRFEYLCQDLLSAHWLPTACQFAHKLWLTGGDQCRTPPIPCIRSWESSRPRALARHDRCAEQIVRNVEWRLSSRRTIRQKPCLNVSKTDSLTGLHHSGPRCIAHIHKITIKVERPSHGAVLLMSGALWLGLVALSWLLAGTSCCVLMRTISWPCEPESSHA